MDSNERRQDQLEEAMGTLVIAEARIEDIARQNLQGITEVGQQRVGDRLKEQQAQVDVVLRMVMRHDLRQLKSGCGRHSGAGASDGHGSGGPAAPDASAPAV